MKHITEYVALDVHQATSVASVREEGGRVMARTILPTESSALVEFFGGMRGAIHVAFEAGTQDQWLHDLLVPAVDRARPRHNWTSRWARLGVVNARRHR